MKLVGIKKIYLSKTDEITTAIKDINLSFEEFGLTVIEGPSGSGKTTLLNIIGGYDEPTGGTIYYNNTERSRLTKTELVTIRRHDIGYYLSDYNLIEHLNLYDNIALSYKLKHEPVNQTEIDSILDKLDISHLKNRYPKELSTGERQRGALARLMVKKPALLLADEPTGALDEVNAKIVMDVFKALSKTSCIIMVTHDETLALDYADRIIRLSNGIVIEDKRFKETPKTVIFKSLNPTKEKFYYRPIELIKGSFSRLLKQSIKTVVVSVMLFLIITLGMVIRGFGNYNTNNAVYDTARKNQINAISITKRDSKNTPSNLKFEDIKTLSKRFGSNVLFKYEEIDLDMDDYRTNSIEETDQDLYHVSFTTSVSIDQMTKLGYDLISGVLPQKNDNSKEIVITKFMFDQLKKFGHSDIDTPITDYASILHKTVYLGDYYEIVGIIDTKLDSNLYKALEKPVTSSKEERIYQNTKTSYQNELIESFHLALFLYDGYLDDYLNEMDSVFMVTDNQFTIPFKDGKVIYIDSFTKYISGTKYYEYKLPYTLFDKDVRDQMELSAEEGLDREYHSHAFIHFYDVKDMFPPESTWLDYYSYLQSNEENSYEPTYNRAYFYRESLYSAVTGYFINNSIRPLIDNKELTYQTLLREVLMDSDTVYLNENMYDKMLKDLNTSVSGFYLIGNESKEAISFVNSNSNYGLDGHLLESIGLIDQKIINIKDISIYLIIGIIVLLTLMFLWHIKETLDSSIEDIAIYKSLGLYDFEQFVIFWILNAMTVLLSAILSLIATVIITTIINHVFSNEMPILYKLISVNYLESIVLIILTLVIYFVMSYLMFTAKLKRNTTTLFREISNREV